MNPSDQTLAMIADKAAIAFTQARHDRGVPAGRERQYGYMEATLEALKVDRESLRLLVFARKDYAMSGHVEPVGITAHIALLRSRLGLTEGITNTTEEK